ncbi:sugar transferase [Gordonia jacobaea]|uniref:sugar transferase n=1 Tax=Gordonia jacobaea TaxID=122202 RepID=UPI003D73B974
MTVEPNRVANQANTNQRVGRPQGAANDKSRDWVGKYVRSVTWTDLLIVTVAITAAQLARFGANDLMEPNGTFRLPALVVSVVLFFAWVLSLQLFQTSDRRIVGSGHREYGRVASACFAVFGTLAILDLLFRLNIARGFLAIALPLGTILLIAGRSAWRYDLRRQRRRGEALEGLLIVGSVGSAMPLLKRIARDPSLGYRPAGICVPTDAVDMPSEVRIRDLGIPVFQQSVLHAIRSSGASTVAISSSDESCYESLREMSWQLEAIGVELLVAPGVVDVAGPRMTVRQVDGLPLLHIDRPQYEASKTVLKAALDYTIAMTALVVLFPLMLATAVAIKVEDRGPVFFRQTRVGRDGATFSVWKFRSMRIDAERIRAEIEQATTPDQVFFKSTCDPRVTRVGRLIRKTSIDELPQLFNVLTREMSLVGPRPLLVGEGAEVPNFVERRLLVKPGITGLWQVSGRSDLEAEDRIRLDLLYVENWTITQDLAILVKTVKAVLFQDGAY